MPEYLEEELTPLPPERIEESGENLEQLEKPYLRVSDLEGSPEKEVLTMEWIDFLLSKTDMRGILDAFSYYIEMGWIGRGVRSTLMSYARYFFQTEHEESLSEIKVGEREYKVSSGGKAQTAERGRNITDKLSLNDHLRSLGYILHLSDRAGEEIRQKIMKKVEQ